MSIISFVASHKVLTCFILLTTAFFISTIILAVENVDLRDQIREQEDSSPSTPSTEPPLTTTTESPDEDMSKYKLPETAAPLSYDLYLYPNLQTGLFKGKVTSAVKILQTTAELILNINKLNISRIEIDQEETSNFEVDVDYERVVIKKKDGGQFSPTTGDASVKLAIDFEGDMRNRIVGLYRSSYTNNQGQTRYIATSKFEPTYARQAYPCFDEPNLKAKYTVHILKPNDPNYIALSNNPQASEELTTDGIMVHFNETVPMSTYLSCFIVSDFVYTETNFQNGAVDVLTPFRVYASPGQLDKTTYAGRVGKAVIEYYINYFNIPYPLPKLDMVAIPDFVSGAMEHWGLVTFRETALLYTETTHSSANKQRVAVVVAHELAHSWFGNLVTMNWWNDLWLNEGFASYIEFKGVLAAEPDWGMLDQFLISQLHSVLSLDATQSSHPIIQTVTTPNEITEVFDTISYNKGASVLRMLEDTVGDRHFQTGVTNYLNKHLYGNAITQDLWTEIQGVLDTNNIAINVSEFMGTFTVQMGYPILTAAVSSDGRTYTLRQKRFLTDPDSETSVPSPLGYKWSVPIKYITNLGESGITWFKYSDNEVTIEKPANAQWLKFNPKQIGYYRINYPENDWKSLSSIIKDLSVSDRTHLLEEAFSIAASGDLSYATALDMTKYLTEEIDYVPWSVASSVLQRIIRYLGNSQYESDFKNYVISLLKPAYEKLTWTENPNDSHLTRRTRVVVLDLACSMDYPEALTQAKEKFDQWISSGGGLSQDLRSLIYQYGMVKADEATWYKLFDLFTNETDASEKLKLMNGLTSIRIPSLLTRLIELAKDETYVRGQDYFTLLQYIAGNPIGQPIIWDYVRENWPKLVDRFGLNERYLGRLIPSITSRFATNLKLEEMGHFFTKYPEAGAGASARLQALETVSNNIKWLNKYRTTVEQWIASNPPQVK